MDFRDSPDEAAFRERLRGWLTEQKGKFPTSGDEYWAKAGEWHAALYEAGFFGTSWPKAYGGQDLPPLYDVIVDEEIAKAGAPARPSLGYLVVGLSHHGNEELRQRFLPGMINGTERWCQGFSEPGAGSDLASLTTTAARDGDEYVISGHKIWTSYSDVADWCLVLARTDKDVPKHKGISAFIVSMHQPGIVQRPLKMISGVTKEFGQVEFDGARVSADNMVGAPGDGWKLAMTVVSHEREPSTLGFSARYGKTVRQLASRVDGPRSRGAVLGVGADRDAAAARAAAAVRAAGRHDARPAGLVGQAADDMGRAVGRPCRAWRPSAPSDEEMFGAYMYSRAQSVMGGTVADSEEHHRAADSRTGELKCTTCQTKSTSRPTARCASSRSTVPTTSMRSTTTCTSGWPRSGKRSTRTPTRAGGRHHRCGPGVLGRRRLQLPRRASQRRSVAAEDDQARSRSRHRHGALSHPGGRRGQRSCRRAGLQPGRAVRHRLHRRDRVLRRPARADRSGGRRRRAAGVAVADQPVAGQGVRVDRCADQGRSAPSNSGWPTTSSKTRRRGDRVREEDHRAAAAGGRGHQAADEHPTGAVGDGVAGLRQPLRVRVVRHRRLQQDRRRADRQDK